MLREQLPQDLTQTPVRKRLSEAAQQLRLGPACLARLTALQLPDTPAGRDAISWFADLFVNRLYEQSPGPCT